MEELQTKFIDESVPVSAEKQENGKFTVSWRRTNDELGNQLID